MQSYTALTNARLVLPDRILEGQTLVIQGNRIAGLAAPDDLGSETKIVDMGGRLITPGLVDIHTHGALGHMFDEPTTEAFGAITAANAAAGVTSVLGTLGGISISQAVACLDFGRRWMATPPAGARLLGMHLESPYVAGTQTGALDPSGLLMPDDGSAEPLFEYADVLRIFMLAPELPGALALIERWAGLNVIIAAGHTAAKEEQILAAMARGLSHVTHIWSAMSMTVREGPWRKPGLVETALVHDGLTVEMIGDNRHLPPTLMKLARKCIDADRLCVVSDATSGAGMPEGTLFRIGPITVEVRDGVGMLLDRRAFGGSTTLLGRMLPILRDVVGAPLVEAVRMCTLTPARVAGRAHDLGSIAPGKLADLAVWDDDLKPWRVMIGGEWATDQRTPV